MGLLSVGTPLSWDETKTYADLIRKKGVEQFLNIHKKLRDRKNDSLKWGDEVEFIIVKFDHVNKKCCLLLRAHELLPTLQAPENRNDKNLVTMWRPEYADYMIEGTPGAPYDHEMSCLNRVEANMRLRRKQILELLDKDEYPLSLTTFPYLGRPNFTWPNYPVTPGQGVTTSLFFCDQAIYPGHPRFAGLSKNIRERRKAKVAINVPVFKDENTQTPFIEDFVQYGDEPGPNTESRLVSTLSTSTSFPIEMTIFGF